MKLVHQRHAKFHISPVAAWHQGSLGLEHYPGRSLTLRHVLENIADSTDGRYEGDMWTLNTALCGLLFVCKVGLSLTVDNALKNTFGLSCKEAEKGVAWLSLLHCEMLDYACTALFFSSLKLTSPMGDF